MKKAPVNFEDLTKEIIEYMHYNLNYSPDIIEEYSRIWARTLLFLERQGDKKFTSNLEEKILVHFLGDRINFQNHNLLSRRAKRIYNAIKILSLFFETGKIAKYSSKKDVKFEGPLKNIFHDFLTIELSRRRLSTSRIRSYRRTLKMFDSFCNLNEVKNIKSVDLPLILNFFRYTSSQNKNKTVHIISTLRSFIEYLFNSGMHKHNLSLKMPVYKNIGQPKLPSTYSIQEIRKLLESIDRSTPTGKRNYAILILAARLGLRASDISNLQFHNINWQNSTINFVQVKTNHDLSLPLLADVGNAILDYLEKGRPISDEPYVFLSARSPYVGFPGSGTITHVAQKAFAKAKIDTRGRKMGAHCLRHSLATRMLEKNNILPLISQTLGHKSTESTRFYLRIDLNSMRNCMLDVPSVNREFYEQEGGVFYV